MSDPIVIIPHSEGDPNSGRFEVRFMDGKPSAYFDWDNDPDGAFQRKMNWQQARKAAGMFAKTEVLRLKYKGPDKATQPTTLQVGERVQLSELGKYRFPRAQITFGSVIRVPKHGGRSVQILFDGNSRPTKVHHSYVERAPELSPKRKRGRRPSRF